MIKGSQISGALRQAMPDAGAAARSLLGILIVAAIALYWGPAGAGTSAAATAAIAGVTALQDSPLGRIPLVVTVSAQAGAVVLLGGLTAGPSAVFVGVVAVWCFFAGLQWAISAHAGLIAAAAGALLVTQPPQSAAAAAVSAVFAVAAGLTQAALIAVWPPASWRVRREALARAYRSLSADARSLAADPDARVDTVQLMELREAFTSNAVQPHAYRDWYGLPEQIAATLTALRDKAKGQDAFPGVFTAAAEVLAAIAASSRSMRRDADSALQRVDIAVAAVSGPEATVAQHLSRQLRQADELRFGQRGVTGWSGALRAAADVVYAQLKWTSPILRHAVRLAGAAAAGVAIARFADVAQGYWIPLTVLLVMRPETAHTYTRCAGRVGGIAAGVLVASSVTPLWQPTGLAAAILAAVFLGVTYAVSGFGYIAVSAALATTIVFLLDVSDVATSIGDTLLATLIGGVLAVLAHVVLPDDAMVRLRQRAGELLKTEIDYAATVIKAFVHDLDHPADALAAAWQRAFRARSAFEAATGATRVESRELRRWLRSYRAALNSVTSSCTALEASLPTHPSTARGRDFVLAVDEYVEALRGDRPSPAKPWSIDTTQLAAANQRLRAVHIESDDGAARVLVAEVGAITRSLSGIALDDRDVAAS
ncbi:MAG: FUSC family protein [Mycobacterium sp.]